MYVKPVSIALVVLVVLYAGLVAGYEIKPYGAGTLITSTTTTDVLTTTQTVVTLTSTEVTTTSTLTTRTLTTTTDIAGQYLNMSQAAADGAIFTTVGCNLSCTSNGTSA